MSFGKRLPFEEAFAIASEASAILKPTVERLKAAGSLRRQQETIGDIEIVAAPFVERDLFGTHPTPVLIEVDRAMRSLGTWVKGGPRYMRITDLLGHEGLSLDLFLVHPPAEWGSILAIRTGPFDLGILAMMGLSERGYAHKDGRVVKGEEPVPTPTEEDFFKLAGIDCLPPNRRDAQANTLKGRNA